MTTKTAVILILLMMAGSLAASLALYSELPDRLPMHWNLNGEVDGWGGKAFGAFFGPGIMLCLLAWLFAGEWVSPVRYKIGPFQRTYNLVFAIMAALLLYLQVVMLAAGLHPGRSYGRWLVSGIFLFFACLGNLLGKTRPNFIVGIRVPWTLADERVWVATHRLAARLLCAMGVLGAICVWLGVPLGVCFGLLAAGLAVPVAYSFVLSKRLERSGSV